MKTSLRRSLLTLCLFATGATMCSVATANTCDRHCLLDSANSYLLALEKHDAHAMPLAKHVKYTENGHALSLTEGLWSQTVKPGNYREIFADAHTGNALVVAVLDAGGKPTIISTRLHSANNKITEIECIVTRQGSHPLFAPQSLATDPLYATAVSGKDRSSRQRLIQIANTYFDGLEQNSSKHILATAECDRFENGVKTTHRGPTSGGCAQSADVINYIKHVRNRRCFIADENLGVLACNVVFDIPGGDMVRGDKRPARMLLLTEIFKIDGGKIQRIQAGMQNLPYGSGSGWEK